MDLQLAIKRCKEEFWNAFNESVEEHHEIEKWLEKLASYEDKTPISDDFLISNGFTKRANDYFYSDGDIEIIAKLFDAEMGVWRVEVGFLDHCENVESLDICTVGQLRMFIAIEGLNELTKQFK